MVDLNRREFVRTATTGTGIALGGGAASAQDSTGDSETEQVVEATFSATVDEGFLVLGGDSPGDQNAIANVDISNLNGTVDIEGEVYEDRTWESTNVNFPELDPGQFIDADDIDLADEITFDDNAKVTVDVDTISGVYDPDAEIGELVTGNANLVIDAFAPGTATAFGLNIDFYFNFIIDLNSGEELTLTTGTSNGLTGEASGLDSVSSTATVVSNDFTVPEATEDPDTPSDKDGICQSIPFRDPICVNDTLSLPVVAPARNWLKLTIEPEWDGNPPQPPFPPTEDPLPGGENPPRDEDGDGAFEDITGSGDVSIVDTQALFDNLDSEAVQNNPEAFNFSESSDDDEVSILDVASHWYQYIKNG